MPVTAGSPIVAEDFQGQVDDNTADIAALETSVTALQNNVELLGQTTPQSGIRIGTTDGNGDLTVSFPGNFAATPVVVACPGGDANGVFHTIVMNNTLAVGSVNVRSRDSTDNLVTGTLLEISWIGQSG